MNTKILVATGSEAIDNKVRGFDGYDVAGSVLFKKELEEAVEYYQPHIVLVSDKLTGQEMLAEILIRIKQKNPQIRIVYLAGQVEPREVDKINRLGMLVMAGIYDISTEKNIGISYIKELCDKPKRYDQVEHLTRHLKERKKEKEATSLEFDLEEEEKVDVEEEGFKNLFVVSSIKPGTGKSFIATNVATAIAKYGKKNARGERPRVALIEADLQNLSVGTLLGIEDDKKNLKTVMDKISTLFSKEDELIADINAIEEANRYILDCFKPYETIKNMYALVGSQFTMEDVQNFKPKYYEYLILAMVEHFDVLIVDSNSSLAHTTTTPIMMMAKNCYYVLNLDFNNVRNNVRYRDTLSDYMLLEKVKYVLNEDIDDPDEKLIFTSEHIDSEQFPLVAKIPEIKKSVFLNRLYEGKPVMIDDTDYTLKARLELAKLANDIWKVDCLEELEAQLEKMYEQNSGKKRKKGFFR